MIPVKLNLSGFLSYREPVEVDFTGFDLACISGANGAGKSSLLDAITWVLFGQARKRDESLIHTRCDAAEVQLVFDYEGNRYRVQRSNRRGKSSVLEFHIQTPDGTWKPLTERTLRDTQARLEETLRLDYETFVNASFFLQGKADQFTQQRPGDRKRILAGILGLDVWENYRRKAAEFRKAVEGEIAVVDGRLAEIEAELSEEDSRREKLGQLETELSQLAQMRSLQETSLEAIRRLVAQLEEQKKFVSSLDRQLAEAGKALESSQVRLLARQQEGEQFSAILGRAAEIQAAHQAWQQAQENLERWEEIASQFREQEKRRQAPLMEIETERARLEQEQRNLREQQIQVDRASEEQAQLAIELEPIQLEVKQLETQLVDRADAEERFSVARQELADARAENPLLKEQMQELKTRIDQLKEIEGALCPVCGQPLDEKDRLRLVADLETQGREMGDRYRANQALLEKSTQIVQELQEQVNQFKQVEESLQAAHRKLDQMRERSRALAGLAQEWGSGGATRLDAVQAALDSGSFALDARSRLADIDAELKKIGYDAAEHDAVRQAVNEGRLAAEELLALERAQAALGPLEREISELQTQVNEQQNNLDERQAEYASAAQALAEAEAQSPDMRQAERDLLDVQERENRLRMQLGAAQQRVLVLDDLKERRQTYQSQREDLSQQVMRYKQLERAFGKDGVPALLIEQALPQIENRANNILERLSGGTMTVRFVTQAEYKDHRREDLRETLDIQISDSAGVRDYEMYSGGEAFRVNFAIRLALAEVLAQRAGARLQTLVIDEGFGSQDALGRQRLVEAINLIRQDFAKILVITHIDELKDVFPVRIEVTKTSQGSQVVVA
jgi:exonuclease SbcC